MSIYHSFLTVTGLDCFPGETACDRVLGGFDLGRTAVDNFVLIFGFTMSKVFIGRSKASQSVAGGLSRGWVFVLSENNSFLSSFSKTMALSGEARRFEGLDSRLL